MICITIHYMVLDDIDMLLITNYVRNGLKLSDEHFIKYYNRISLIYLNKRYKLKIKEKNIFYNEHTRKHIQLKKQD